MRVPLATLFFVGLSIAGALAETFAGDHLIVPGERIGNAELEPADQGALQRNLGEPNETDQQDGMATYRYGVPRPDGGAPDELVVMLDLGKDAPFEIATAAPAYHTREGLSVGSSDAAIRAALGPPICDAKDGQGNGILVYGTIWFRTAQGTVTRAAIRTHLSVADFQTGAIHC